MVDQRLSAAVGRVKDTGLPLIYLNQIGGQDELVFEGASFVLNGDGSLAAQLPAFAEAIVTTHWTRKADGWHCAPAEIAPLDPQDQSDYTACMLGLRDYVGKNGFPGVVLGLSGGIDSALVAAIGVDALGAERVRAVMLPYKFTSQESLADAAAVAAALGIRYDIVPIESAVLGLERTLAPVFEGLKRDVTEENLQARARGTILMALSNKFGSMVMTTGNKSEMSTGYATLYGDMNGGFNPIKDLYKTEVFRLSELRNTWKPKGALGPDGVVIPQNVITKPPTAELRENQKDQDSLPPYDMLDGILERLVELEQPIADIVAAGFDAGDRDARRPHAQSRRIQAPPGGAGREGDAARFRARPPLSDHQQVPRSRHPIAEAGRNGHCRRCDQDRSVRFLGQPQ